MLLINNNFNATEIKFQNIQGSNVTAARIELGHRIINFIVLYRPPNQREDLDIMLYTQISNIIGTRDTIIVGDFNCPKVEYNLENSNSEGRRLVRFSEDNFLTQLINETTRHTNKLDLVFSTDEDLISNVNVREPLGHSDHNMIEFYINVNTKRTSNENLVPNFKLANFENFNTFLSRTNWVEKFCNLNANDAWNKFKEIFWTYDNICIPRRVKRKPNPQPKWYNSEIGQLIKSRNIAYKSFKRNNTSETHNHYILKRRAVKSCIKKAKRKYETKLSRACRENPKSFYEYVNNRKTIKNEIGPLVDNNGIIAQNTKSNAEILNNFFSSVFTNENLNEIPNPPDRTVFTPDNTLNNITFYESEVSKYIDKIKLSKSPGPDLFYPAHLKNLKMSIVRPLTQIFNKSFENKTVPTDFKLANVTPIFKKGDRQNAGNYRPISLTSIPGKIQETIIRDRLIDYLEANNLIHNSQHGFRRHRSTTTNLIEFYNYIVDIFDNHKSVDVIYLDFKKAFDTVPHKRLIKKLYAHGIRNRVLEWIENWLKDRRQRVVINGVESNWVNVSSGVPQGSVLGPLLFIIYINDLDDTTNCAVSKFADDTKIGAKILNLDDRDHLQSDVNIINNWAKKWQLSFNVDKCCVMHFGTRNRQHNYHMTNLDIKSVDETKDLGTIVTRDLKAHKQCEEACKKANRILGFISRNFEFKSADIIVPLYKSLVRPHLEYAIQFWSPYTIRDVEKLERVQRRATKLIPWLRNKSYEERLKHLGLLSLQTRRLRGELIQAFKILKRFDNVDLERYFELDYYDVSRNNGVKLKNKRFETDVARNFFTYKITSHWNSLPARVVASSSINMFKNRLDEYLKLCNRL